MDIQWFKQQRKVPAIMGPTATGKTDLALALADVLPIEIINVDSALVYRGMDIGTAKPSEAERNKVRHHLIDIIDPVEVYSAADFVEDAQRLVDEIFARDKLPVFVGGTMMYFNALQKGLARLPSASPDIRAELERQWQADPDALYQKLQQVDPTAAQRIKSADFQRISRALEVYQLTGQPLSTLQQQTEKRVDFDLIKFGLIPQQRTQLHKKIAQRFHAMLAAGFEQEVRSLYQREDLTSELPSIRAVGYRQMWGYLAGEYDWETMVQKGIAATRQLAKRQLTWLRREEDLLVLDPYGASSECKCSWVLEHLDKFVKNQPVQYDTWT